MLIRRMLAGRLAFGALLLMVLIAVTACGSTQPTPAATTEAAADSAASDTAASVLAAYRAFGGDIVALSAEAPSTEAAVADLTGTIPAYSLTGGNPPCPGFIRQAPNLVFTLADAAPEVHLAFTGNQATNLIVVQEGEEIMCPEVAAATLTPSITLTDAQAGRYGVWVGRIDMEQPVDGKLTVTVAK